MTNYARFGRNPDSNFWDSQLIPTPGLPKLGFSGLKKQTLFFQKKTLFLGGKKNAPKKKYGNFVLRANKRIFDIVHADLH